MYVREVCFALALTLEHFLYFHLNFASDDVPIQVSFLTFGFTGLFGVEGNQIKRWVVLCLGTLHCVPRAIIRARHKHDIFSWYAIILWRQDKDPLQEI